VKRYSKKAIRQGLRGYADSGKDYEKPAKTKTPVTSLYFEDSTSGERWRIAVPKDFAFVHGHHYQLRMILKNPVTAWVSVPLPKSVPRKRASR
jgi:hypothetical protein